MHIVCSSKTNVNMNSVRGGDYDDCEGMPYGMLSQSIWQVLCTGMST
jgi:hypothetical protein